MAGVVHEIETVVDELVEHRDARCLGWPEKRYDFDLVASKRAELLEDLHDLQSFLLRAWQRGVFRRIRHDQHAQVPSGKERWLGQRGQLGAKLPGEAAARAEKYIRAELFVSA